jgi:hypothetical protein
VTVQIQQPWQDHPTGGVDPNPLGALGLDGLDIPAGANHDKAVLTGPAGVSTQPCSAIASTGAARTANSRDAAAAGASWGGGISATIPAR